MPVKCGNCKKHHEGVAGVRACYAKVGVFAVETRTVPRAKVGLTSNFLSDSDLDGEAWLRKQERDYAASSWSSADRERAQCRATYVAKPSVTQDGMYRRQADGQIFRVQIAKQGSGHLYAKRLAQSGESWSFVYAPGALQTLSPDDRMTIEAAKEFGALYGVCCVCGRDLTDEKSIAAGIGPICAGKV